MVEPALLHVCTSCGYFGTRTEQFCPLCGAHLVSECESCGRSIANPFARYCVGCGMLLTYGATRAREPHGEVIDSNLRHGRRSDGTRG